MMQRVLFGDNQFFGVNHLSEEKARWQAVRFQNDSAIIEVLDAAYQEGIRVFMCTTQDRMIGICEHFRDNQALYPDFEFYPCMPYAHKYANAVTEYGVMGAMNRFLPEGKRVQTLLKGGLSLARKDVHSAARLLIDAEMAMFRGLRTPYIFLQNVVTDLLLGLGYTEAFRVFAEHIQTEYGAEPGFITMNLPMLLDALDDAGIENPVVCANFNKIGFRMCGGIDAYEELTSTRKFRFIAMSVLASGGLSPSDAIEYVTSQEGVKAIVFGASSRANIRQTKQLIDQFDHAAAARAVDMREPAAAE